MSAAASATAPQIFFMSNPLRRRDAHLLRAVYREFTQIHRRSSPFQGKSGNPTVSLSLI
jgi:ABC-type sugar transport system ATPase subunit